MDAPPREFVLYFQDILPSDFSLCFYCHTPFLTQDMLPVQEELVPGGPSHTCCADCYDAFLMSKDQP